MFGKRNENRRKPQPGRTLMARLSADASSDRPWHVRLLLRAGFLAIFAGLLLVAGWWLRENWIYRIPALAIREISVEVDGSLAPEEVRRLAAVKIGRNILTVDLPELRDRLQSHPRIAAARIVVEFPGTLAIRIRERFPLVAVEPLARNGLDARYLLDDSGHVILPLQPGHAPPENVAAENALPLLLGYQPGMPLSESNALRALEFLREYESLPTNSVPDIRSVSIAAPGILVVAAADGSEVTFGTSGTPDYRTQILRWRETLVRLADLRREARETRTLKTLDLSVSQNAPIQWVTETPSTPSSETPDRQVRPRLKRITRRSNV